MSQDTSEGQVAEMAKRCTPSKTDVIFVVMDALVRIYVDDLNAGRDVTALWCSCAFDLSQSTGCQSERASASSELHSWLRPWCSRTCQDRFVGRIQRSLLCTSKTRPDDEHHNLEVQSSHC